MLLCVLFFQALQSRGSPESPSKINKLTSFLKLGNRGGGGLAENTVRSSSFYVATPEGGESLHAGVQHGLVGSNVEAGSSLAADVDNLTLNDDSRSK